ncbi:hypothetical protein FP507_02540 [Chlorobium phaeovibrioides]|uniref:VanZ family protein n=1 Tax=Chlorobium phaeovibrioides TaxID=1094 RepID=A0A5M8ICM3_CHLPH|nr:VanZ family protein [Chlorobium phaeovibrioides]KAA6232099.1 hypothetical protein FP507_02540 [Chlorobium phaeovibrioides]
MVKIAGRVVTLGMLVCLFMVALAQKGEVPLADGLNDKWAHLLAFAVLAIGFSVWWQIKTWLMVLGLIFYGVAIEVAQLYVPYHHATVLDLLADGAGIAVGVILLFFWRRYVSLCWSYRGTRPGS